MDVSPESILDPPLPGSGTGTVRVFTQAKGAPQLPSLYAAVIIVGMLPGAPSQ